MEKQARRDELVSDISYYRSMLDSGCLASSTGETERRMRRMMNECRAELDALDAAGAADLSPADRAEADRMEDAAEEARGI